MALLLGLGLLVAWSIAIPKKLPSVAWNSAWVFRAEVFVGFFVGSYVLLVIVISTVLSARPPKKLSFGLLAIEDAAMAKTVAALSEGGSALQAMEAEVTAFSERLDESLDVTRVSLQALIDLATQTPGGADVADRARAQLTQLDRTDRTTESARNEFTRAMSRFDQLLGDLERLAPGQKVTR
jgi:hypothetical protein